MPRPKKWRKVCCLPKNSLFGSIDVSKLDDEEIIMTVEEYETIRLIDLEEMTQEECSKRMNVARTTVQRIYNSARKKLAKTIVDGNILKIEGGSYRLYDERDEVYRCGKCRKKRHGSNHTNRDKNR